MSNFFTALDCPEYKDGFVQTFTSDCLDQSEFWPDDSDEFADLFEACASTQEGAAFISFLVGHKTLKRYLQYMSKELGLDADSDADEE